MKKNILYLLAFISVIFAACNPLKDEINNINPATAEKTLVVTAAKNYETVDLANVGISAQLNKDYAHMPDGTKASVTFKAFPGQFKPADSIVSSSGAVPTQYKVTNDDYQAINQNTNKNFTTTNAIKFLDTRLFPTKLENQLIVLNYMYFESGSTTSGGVEVTDTYIYLNGAWTKAYHVTQAQYISAGKLALFNFGTADEPNLTGYFNTFLKSDASVSGKAKIGDLKYVSYAFFNADRKTCQRIKVLKFDGANWGTTAVPNAALAFLKKKGTWIPDPTVYYALVKNDYAVLKSEAAAEAKVGTAAGRTNAGDFGSFDVTGGTNSWTETQINDALIFILNGKYASAPVDETVLYNITYALYKGPKPTLVKTFTKTSSGFVFVPAVD